MSSCSGHNWKGEHPFCCRPYIRKSEPFRFNCECRQSEKTIGRRDTVRDKHSLSNYMVCNLLAVRLLRRGPCPLPCIDNRNFRLVPSVVTVHIELDCESGYKPSAVQNYIYGKVHVVDRSTHFSEKSRFQVPLPDHSTACQGHDTMPSAGRVPRAILYGPRR